jgi:hypothetical protein
VQTAKGIKRIIHAMNADDIKIGLIDERDRCVVVQNADVRD